MIETLRATLRPFAGLAIRLTLLFLMAVCANQIPHAYAQGRTSALVEKINSNTIMVLTAGSGLTYGAMASDLATLLNDGDDLRILPVQGHSAFQNVRDVRYLRGIDVAFTQSNVLGHYRRKGLTPDLNERITYLLKICNNEVHLITRADITSIEQLRGKKVNFNVAGSGSQLTAQDLFQLLGIQVEEVNMRQQDALEKMKTGEVVATVALAGKPAPPLVKLKAKDGYRLLPIPYNKSMAGDFAPTNFTHEDYPELVPAGQKVETVASGVILIAYNWPKNTDRYRRVDKFVKAFFPRLAEFHKPPRHEKWKETILATELPGWQRFPSADEWIRQTREEALNARRNEFDQFLATRTNSPRALPEKDRKKLFEEFLKWSTRDLEPLP
jgi:TRAP transporter TAXI family solute receptor